MTEHQQVSIIIPVRNGLRFLAACLDSLLAQQVEAPELALRVVLIDNGSIDGSADWVAQHYPTVELIRNMDNRGFAGGCNQGLAAAPAEIAILLNQDTSVYPGWLRAIADAFHDPTVGVVGCKIYYPDGLTLQHTGGYIKQPQLYGIHYGQDEVDQGQGDLSRSVEWVTGAAFAIHRRALEQVGLLDEGFWPGYFEDMDYCFRTRAAGLQVWYCAAAILRHQPTSSKIDDESLQRFYQRGRLRFALKHLPPDQWLGEFLAAERVDGGRGTPARQAAYWTTLLAAPEIIRSRWQADDQQVRDVVAALHELIGEPPPPEPSWPAGIELPAAMDDLPGEDKARLEPMSALTMPSFTELAFSSGVPMLGSLLSGIRRLWYNVAARWGVRHLQIQQERINWLLVKHIDTLERQAIHSHHMVLALQEQSLYLRRQVTHLLRQDSLLRRNSEVFQHQLDQLSLVEAGLAQQLDRLAAPPAAERDISSEANQLSLFDLPQEVEIDEADGAKIALPLEQTLLVALSESLPASPENESSIS